MPQFIGAFTKRSIYWRLSWARARRSDLVNVALSTEEERATAARPAIRGARFMAAVYTINLSDAGILSVCPSQNPTRRVIPTGECRLMRIHGRPITDAECPIVPIGGCSVPH